MMMMTRRRLLRTTVTYHRESCIANKVTSYPNSYRLPRWHFLTQKRWVQLSKNGCDTQIFILKRTSVGLAFSFSNAVCLEFIWSARLTHAPNGKRPREWERTLSPLISTKRNSFMHNFFFLDGHGNSFALCLHIYHHFLQQSYLYVFFLINRQNTDLNTCIIYSLHTQKKQYPVVDYSTYIAYDTDFLSY